VLDGIDHNASMSAPDGQVARLRPGHAPKFFDPSVQVRRTRVPIREAGTLIEFVNQVGAIGREVGMMPRIQSGAQNHQTLARRERPYGNRLLLRVRVFTRDSMSRVRPFPLLLREHGRDGGPAEQKE
jgi:hypothetical protein